MQLQLQSTCACWCAAPGRFRCAAGPVQWAGEYPVVSNGRYALRVQIGSQQQQWEQQRQRLLAMSSGIGLPPCDHRRSKCIPSCQ
jgi:hypothetical protein